MTFFHKFVQSNWMAAVLFIADLYFLFLIGCPLAISILLLAISFPVLWLCWRIFRKNVAAGNIRHYIAFAVLGLLLCLMLPSGMLTDVDRLVTAFSALHPPALVLRVVNFFENISVLGLADFFVFLLIFVFWIKASRFTPPDQIDHRALTLKGLRILFFSLPCLLVWSLFLYIYWPGILTADSISQWAQIQDVRTIYDWHPVGHTLFEFLLTRIWFSPAVISIFQVVALAAAWGWVMSFFEERGISRRALFISSVVFALLPFNGMMLVTLWKDIPFAIVNLILAFLLGVIWYTNGEWLKRWTNCVWLGIILAWTYLFRHNGLLLLIFIPPAVALFYLRQWKGALFSTVVAIAVVLVVRNGIAFGILKAKTSSDAVLYVVPIQHISAVIYYDGQITKAQRNILERLAPIDVWKREYNPFMADTMTKPWGVMQDPDVLNKIDQNKSDLMRTFFDLAWKYPRIVFRSELDLMGLQWEIIPPGGDGYKTWKLDFFVLSEKLPDWIFHQELFAQPRKDTPIKAAFDSVMLFIDKNLLTYPIFWRGGLYLFLAAVCATLLWLSRGWRSILITLPVILNSVSLALSMPVQNFRYVYPNILIALLLIFFTFLSPQNSRERVRVQRSAEPDRQSSHPA